MKGNLESSFRIAVIALLSGLIGKAICVNSKNQRLETKTHALNSEKARIEQIYIAPSNQIYNQYAQTNTIPYRIPKTLNTYNHAQKLNQSQTTAPKYK